MKDYIFKIKKNILAHKIISGIVIIVIIGGGYYFYTKSTSTTGETRYITTTVKKGTIVSTVSGSGQISAINQVNITAKVSGEITWISAKVGQKVFTGQALAGIDSKTAQQAVDDATASLVQAKLQFQKDQASAPIDYQNTIDNLNNAKSNLASAYNDIFNTISNTYLDLPNIVTGMDNTLHGFDLSLNSSQWNIDVLKNIFTNKSSTDGDIQTKINSFADKAESDYKPARLKYDTSLQAYKLISRTGDPKILEKLLSDSIDTTTAIAQSLQSELNFLGTVIDTANQNSIKLSSIVTTLQTNTRNYLSTTNSDLSNLLSQKKSLETIKQTITTSENNIELLKVGNDTGSNPISLQIAQNNLIKQERDLETLKSNLNDYTVVAPFAGTIASVSANVGDSAGTIASIITNQQIAQLSLNEVDASKVSVGQKATLTFDAISDLSLTGTVAEISPVGTVSQGVVSYTAKITFDSQDARVKPGMTVNASIQSAVHQDTLYVPSSAIKTSNGTSYVLVFDPALPEASSTSAGVASITPPSQVTVTTGITDDTNIEILSGITEGQQVVSRTIVGTTAKNTTTPSATSILGGGGGGGGVIRMQQRD